MAVRAQAESAPIEAECNLVALAVELPLCDWIAVASAGQHRAPEHLRDWCESIEACLNGGVRACCAIPVRHWKTWTTIYGIAWLLARKPKLRVIVMCADHERALELGKMIRRTCEMVGVGPVRGDNVIHDWKNEYNGGVCTMSAAQSRLGRDVDVLICDDPMDEHSSLDPKAREAVDHGIAHYTARAVRDGQAGSVLILMSRWSPDDPIGRRITRTACEWAYVTHPAISDEGKPFAPEVMDLPLLEQTRRELAEQDPSERLWYAQFQQDPRVAGEAIFGEPTRYAELPAYHGFRDAIGIDMSYSMSKTADYFALVVGRAYGGALFIRRVVRMRADINTVENELHKALTDFGQCPTYTYVAGPEIGAVQYLASRGLRVVAIPARYNKLVRSQRTRVAWNGGKIQLPVGVENDGFIRRAQTFRGADGDQDDEIDALTSLYDGIISASSGAPSTGGRPRF